MSWKPRAPSHLVMLNGAVSERGSSEKGTSAQILRVAPGLCWEGQDTPITLVLKFLMCNTRLVP